MSGPACLGKIHLHGDKSGLKKMTRGSNASTFRAAMESMPEPVP